jgi:hypothetical protein
MISDIKRNKNIAIIYRKYKTGTQCLSCSQCRLPDHCSENFEQGHPAAHRAFKSKLKDRIRPCFRKGNFKR